MKKLPVVIVLVLLSVSAIALAASTKKTRFHGGICQPISGSVGYGTYGIHNTFVGGAGGAGGGNVATVLCPLSLSATAGAGENVVGATIVYYDRGAQTRVSCTLQGIDPATGNTIWNSNQVSPTGGINAPPQTFNFTFQTSAESNQVIAVCTIPPMNGVWGSHITTILLTSTTP